MEAEARSSIHKPLKRAAATAIAIYSVSLAYFVYAHQTLPLFPNWSSLWLVLGVIYIYIIEPIWHRYPMHEIVKFYGLRYLGRILKWLFDPLVQSHRIHHQSFEGKNFQNNDPERHKQVTTHPRVFPILYIVHCVLFLIIVPDYWVKFAPAFFLGITCRFIVYETFHKLAHTRNSALDKHLPKIPLVGQFAYRLWVYLVKYHEEHHETPYKNFGFVPPYLMDKFWKYSAKFRAAV